MVEVAADEVKSGSVDVGGCPACLFFTQDASSSEPPARAPHADACTAQVCVSAKAVRAGIRQRATGQHSKGYFGHSRVLRSYPHLSVHVLRPMHGRVFRVGGSSRVHSGGWRRRRLWASHFDVVISPRIFRQTAMGWDPDGDTVVAGLHVRHGDKSWDVEHQASYFGGLAKYGEFAPSTHPPSCVTGLCGCIGTHPPKPIAPHTSQRHVLGC